MKRMAIVMSVLVLAGVIIGCSQDASEGPSGEPILEVVGPRQVDLGALFEQKCAQCHELDRAAKYEGDETWAEVVQEMIDEHGASITEAEAAGIVAHLTRVYPK